MAKPELPSRPARPAVRLRLRINVGEVIAVGPGKIALLEAIAECGSISAAARHLEMSYRRAWLLLDELNRSLLRPAATTAQGGDNGGGAALTPTGTALVSHYRQAERDGLAAARPELAKLLRLVRKA